MTYTDTNISKQTRSRREQPKTPSELLILLCRRYETDSKEKLQARFRDSVMKDDDLIIQTIDFWLALNYGRLIDPPKPRPRPKKNSSAAEAAVKAAEEAIKERAVKRLLLDWEFNGKKLRDMTREECAGAGGWLTRIARNLKPGQKVGEVLSEEQIADLFKPA